MLVAGVDEVHYGCIFGPVYAAAVIVPQKFHVTLAREGVRDSKQILKESERRHLARLILQTCICGIPSTACPNVRLAAIKFPPIARRP